MEGLLFHLDPETLAPFISNDNRHLKTALSLYTGYCSKTSISWSQTSKCDNYKTFKQCNTREKSEAFLLKNQVSSC